MLLQARGEVEKMMTLARVRLARLIASPVARVVGLVVCALVWLRLPFELDAFLLMLSPSHFNEEME